MVYLILGHLVYIDPNYLFHPSVQDWVSHGLDLLRAQNPGSQKVHHDLLLRYLTNSHRWRNQFFTWMFYLFSATLLLYLILQPLSPKGTG